MRSGALPARPRERFSSGFNPDRAIINLSPRANPPISRLSLSLSLSRARAQTPAEDSGALALRQNIQDPMCSRVPPCTVTHPTTVCVSRSDSSVLSVTGGRGRPTGRRTDPSRRTSPCGGGPPPGPRLGSAPPVPERRSHWHSHRQTRKHTHKKRTPTNWPFSSHRVHERHQGGVSQATERAAIEKIARSTTQQMTELRGTLADVP